MSQWHAGDAANEVFYRYDVSSMAIDGWNGRRLLSLLVDLATACTVALLMAGIRMPIGT